MNDIVDELRACAPIDAYSNQGEVETRQSLTSRAADEIERLGHVAAGRLRWVSMMIDNDKVSFQAQEWADEMDPDLP